ncbi:YheU family protein [Marinobacteraceae bacterium S3BR75-40.1]
MIIPIEMMSREALEGLVEEYCTREHGCNDTEEPFKERKEKLLKQLESGEVVILSTPNNPNQVATLVSREELENQG